MRRFEIDTAINPLLAWLCGFFASTDAALKREETQAVVFGDAGVVLEAQGLGRVLMRLDELTPKWISLVAYSTDEIIKWVETHVRPRAEAG